MPKRTTSRRSDASVTPVVGDLKGWDSVPAGLGTLFLSPDGCRADHLTLFLPNGYGLLPYATQICQSLFEGGRSVAALEFPGQGNSPGELGPRVAAESLQNAILYLTEQNIDFRYTLLAQCTGVFAALELRHRWASGLLKRPDGILLYGYLADPMLHARRFHARAKRYGVRLQENVGARYTSTSYAELHVPISVIHPRIRSNEIRATEAELRDLSRLGNVVALTRPDWGYDISARQQGAKIERFVKAVLEPTLAELMEVSVA